MMPTASCTSAVLGWVFPSLVYSVLKAFLCTFKFSCASFAVSQLAQSDRDVLWLMVQG